MSRGSVLVVSHEEQTRRSLRATLVTGGYEVTDASGCDEALDLLRGVRCDLALLEEGMPGKSGFDTSLAIRASGSQIGVIVFSAQNNEQVRVLALEIGADDYVSRPFSDRELLARIAAVLRRKTPHFAGEALQILRLGNRTIDFQIRAVTTRGREVPLRYNEFKILSCLASRANRPVSDDELAGTLWPSDNRDRKGSLRVIIKRLRSKIEPSPQNPRYLITEPGFGYRIQLRDPSATSQLAPSAPSVRPGDSPSATATRTPERPSANVVRRKRQPIRIQPVLHNVASAHSELKPGEIEL
jgi:two-component system KDP operon response regulator KdpE